MKPTEPIRPVAAVEYRFGAKFFRAQRTAARRACRLRVARRMVERSGTGPRAAPTGPVSMQLRQHDVTLIGGRVTLRPLTEDDWDVLLAWNGDPEILRYTESGDVRGYDLAQVQDIYRAGTSRRSAPDGASPGQARKDALSLAGGCAGSERIEEARRPP